LPHFTQNWKMQKMKAPPSFCLKLKAFRWMHLAKLQLPLQVLAFWKNACNMLYLHLETPRRLDWQSPNIYKTFGCAFQVTMAPDRSCSETNNAELVDREGKPFFSLALDIYLL
jgi:hypothetical protein